MEQNNISMTDSRLYFEFNEIASDDYSEQVEFFEKNLYFLKNPESLDKILSRKEFMRRIFILENCSIAFSVLNNHRKALEISNLIVKSIERNKSKFNIDLNKEFYYLNSLSTKGKSLYYLKEFNEAEQTFKTLLEYDFLNQIDSINWFIDSKYSRIFSELKFQSGFAA